MRPTLQQRGFVRPVYRTVGGCGLAFLLVAILCLAFNGPLYSHIMNIELVMAPTAIGYEFWQKSDVPIYMRFYLWNVTNAAAVLDNHQQPILQQLGPYVFREKHNKVNMTWHENGTVTYMQVKTWYFRPDLSNGSLEDQITTLNVPLLAAAPMVRSLNRVLKYLFNDMLEVLRIPVFVTHSAREFLFDGYRDALLDTALIAKYAMDFVLPFDKFGWFYSRNNSVYYDGVFTMDTGKRNIQDLGILRYWNGTNTTTAYYPPCNQVNGTTGELFMPRLPRTHIQLYSPDLCRSVSVPYTDDLTVKGLQGQRYQADHMVFASPEVNPENACFCTGVCPPTGLLNETLCRFGAPAFVSFPHMLYADPSVRSQTVGQQPNVSRHNFSIVVEPVTGVPLNVRARFQINMHLYPQDHINLLENVPDLYMPMVWFENTVDVSDKAASQLFLAVDTLPRALLSISLLLLALSLSLVAAAVIGVVSSMHSPRLEQKPPHSPCSPQQDDSANCEDETAGILIPDQCHSDTCTN